MFIRVGLFIAFLFLGILSADLKGVTNDGKPVILKSDGTWEYIETAPPSTTKNDFRKAKWGMTKDQVKASEVLKIGKELNETLMYTGTIASYSAIIGYIFTDNKFVRASYLLTEDHVNKIDYISDFNSLKKLLTKKYGEPISDEIYWKKNLYRNDPQYWGTAVSMGHLVYLTEWDTDRTKISMILMGDNYQITHKIEYKSKDLAVLEEKKRDADLIKDL